MRRNAYEFAIPMPHFSFVIYFKFKIRKVYDNINLLPESRKKD